VAFISLASADVSVESLRVMTYNIQGHAVLRRQRHIEDVAAVVRQLRPDVLGLQEVHRGTHSGRSGDQLQQLASATGMELFFGQTIERLGGEYGNAILTRGSIESGRTWPLGGKGEARSLLGCRIALGGLRFTFLVAHLAAWFRFHRASRAAQIEQLGEVLSTIAPPFILVGDFNTPPRAPEMQRLLRDEHLAIAGEHSEKSHRLSRTRLDYVFTDRSWKTEASWVVRIGPSDHWPLVADLVREDSRGEGAGSIDAAAEVREEGREVRGEG
jgi:endonuclease/exonuclease/phosphatase family metal-dependent hydrolase